MIKIVKLCYLFDKVKNLFTRWIHSNSDPNPDPKPYPPCSLTLPNHIQCPEKVVRKKKKKKAQRRQEPTHGNFVMKTESTARLRTMVASSSNGRRLQNLDSRQIYELRWCCSYVDMSFSKLNLSRDSVILFWIFSTSVIYYKLVLVILFSTWESFVF